MIGTFAAFAGTLAAYKFFNIKVGDKFRMMVIAAMFGMVAVSLMESCCSMFDADFGLFGFGSLGMLIAVAGLVLGVFMLIMDFDFVEQGIADRPARARVVARGVRDDRQPGVDLHQPAAPPGDLQQRLTPPTTERPRAPDPGPVRHVAASAARPRRLLGGVAGPRPRCAGAAAAVPQLDPEPAYAAAGAADLGAVELGAGVVDGPTAARAIGSTPSPRSASGSVLVSGARPSAASVEGSSTAASER